MRAVLLEARLAAAPGLPGPLQGLVLDMEAPAALGDPSKVFSGCAHCDALMHHVASTQRGSPGFAGFSRTSQGETLPNLKRLPGVDDKVLMRQCCAV